MFPVLNVTNDITHCGHMGHVIQDFEKMCQLANKYGYKGVNIDMQATDLPPPEERKMILHEFGLQPVAFGFTPQIFNPDNEVYLESVETFRWQLEAANTIGVHLALCYLPPFSTELNFNDLFILVANRLRGMKPLLDKYAVRIGFEFIGPVETRQESRYDFIHTIDGTRALIAAAGLYGMGGFKLDVHHWQYSGASLLDLKHLDLETIFYVELNDSLRGYDLFSMPEFSRELPFATGKTDVGGFLKGLWTKGYRGPIAIEPWNEKIATLPLEHAVMEIRKSLQQCLDVLP